MTELWIKGELIEMNSSTVIHQNINAGDLGDIKSNKSVYTNRFKIPKTSKNIMLFNGLGHIPGNISKAHNEKLDAKLVVGGVELLSNAWCRVLASDDKFYELAIYDKAIDFADVIRNKKITDLDFRGYNHFPIFEAPKFIDTFKNKDGYIYALGNFREDSEKLSESGDNHVDILWQLPSFYVHTLWDMIFKEAGFEYEGALFDSSEFKEEVLAPSQNRWAERHNQKSSTASTIACAEIDKENDFNDHLTFYESSGYFAGKADEARSRGDTQEADRLDQEADRVRKSCPYSRSDIILSDYPRGSDNILINYDGGLRINIKGFEVTIPSGYDIEGVELSFMETKRYNLTLVSGKYKPADIEADSQVKNGDSIEMRLIIKIRGESMILGDLDGVTVKGSASFQRISQTGGKPSMINFEDVLPDIVQEDFINDVMHRYGLVFHRVNKAGETPRLKFKHFEDIFKDDDPQDWSDKLVRVTRMEYAISDKNYSQSNYMKYDYADDYRDNRKIFEELKSDKHVEHEFDGNLKCVNKTLKITNDLFSSPYSVHGFQVYKEETTGEFKSEILQINLDKSGQLRGINTPVWDVPIYGKEGDKIKSTDPQIFRVKVINDSAVFHFTTGDSGTYHVPIPYLSRYHMGYQYFIDKYWNLFRQILNNQRKVTALFKLSMIDIHDIDLFKLKHIWQLSRHYYLNKIVGFTGQGLTKCELIEIPLSADKLDKLERMKYHFAGNPYPKVSGDDDYDQHTGFNKKLITFKVVDRVGNPAPGISIHVTSYTDPSYTQVLLSETSKTDIKGEHEVIIMHKEGTYYVEAKNDEYNISQRVEVHLQAKFVPPTADAGEDFTLASKADGGYYNHALEGTVTPGTYPIASWKWSILSKPTGSENVKINDSDKQQAVFQIRRDIKNTGTYVIQFDVCDTHGNCVSDDVKLNYTFNLIDPTVDAGEDFTFTSKADGVNIGHRLKGTATKGSYPIARWKWFIVAKPTGSENVRITDSDKQQAVFQILRNVKNSGSYTIQLDVCDTHGNCVSDDVKLNYTFNLIDPTVDAGEDFTFTSKADGVNIGHRLKGTATKGSYPIARWKWFIVAKPTGSENVRITDSDKQQALFQILRNVKNSGSYTIQLDVCDTHGNCVSDDVKLNYTFNLIDPTVDAGEDFTFTSKADGVNIGHRLKGTATKGSYPIARWKWFIVAKPTGSENVRITDSDKQQALFQILRNVKNSGSYTIQLDVCDTHGNCVSDDVKLNYTFNLIDPTVDAGEDFTFTSKADGVNIGHRLKGTATKGSYPIARWKWFIVAKPTGSENVRITDSDKQQALFQILRNVKNSGSYTIQLDVCDTHGNCVSDDVKLNYTFNLIDPTVDAGEDFTFTSKADGVNIGHRLKGTATKGSYPIALYKWFIVAKPTGSENVRITDSDKQQALFQILRNVKNSGSYTIQLDVCDTHGNCVSDDVKLKYIFTPKVDQVEWKRGYDAAKDNYELWVRSSTTSFYYGMNPCDRMADFSIIREEDRTAYQKGYMAYKDEVCFGYSTSSETSSEKTDLLPIGDIQKTRKLRDRIMKLSEGLSEFADSPALIDEKDHICYECATAKEKLNKINKEFEDEVKRDSTSGKVIEKADLVRVMSIKLLNSIMTCLKSQGEDVDVFFKSLDAKQDAKQKEAEKQKDKGAIKKPKNIKPKDQSNGKKG